MQTQSEPGMYEFMLIICNMHVTGNET